MKKSFIVYILTLSISLLLSYSSKAQQQKKPSERSFAAEINKIKTIQATRDQKISKLQQPTENWPGSRRSATRQAHLASSPVFRGSDTFGRW